jgi:hypothetical protein
MVSRKIGTCSGQPPANAASPFVPETYPVLPVGARLATDVGVTRTDVETSARFGGHADSAIASAARMFLSCRDNHLEPHSLQAVKSICAVFVGS